MEDFVSMYISVHPVRNDPFHYTGAWRVRGHRNAGREYPGEDEDASACSLLRSGCRKHGSCMDLCGCDSWGGIYCCVDHEYDVKGRQRDQNVEEERKDGRSDTAGASAYISKR